MFEDAQEPDKRPLEHIPGPAGGNYQATESVSGYQEWMASENNTKILATAVEERWEEELLSGASSKPNTKTRMAVAWELFQALPEEERSEWLARAKNTAQHNKKEYNNLLKVPPSKNPVDRQM